MKKRMLEFNQILYQNSVIDDNIATLERPVDLNISENNIVDGLGRLVNIIDDNTPKRPVTPNTPELIDMILDISENRIVCEFNNHKSQEIEFKQNVPKL